MQAGFIQNTDLQIVLTWECDCPRQDVLTSWQCSSNCEISGYCMVEDISVGKYTNVSALQSAGQRCWRLLHPVSVWSALRIPGRHSCCNQAPMVARMLFTRTAMWWCPWNCAMWWQPPTSWNSTSWRTDSTLLASVLLHDPRRKWTDLR